VGRFPTVVFSSQDLQLVRGAPALRRRWLDLTLSSMDPEYLAALVAYSRALADRNRLLRRADPGSVAQLAAFDRALAPAGVRIVALRTAAAAELAGLVAEAYGRLTGSREGARVRYVTTLAGVDPDGLVAQLGAGRERDLRAGTTGVGPHRDDLAFEVEGADAADFGSEGQQRSVVLALRLAEAGWFQARSGVRPVLLADDVLGELDPARRDRFWSALDPQAQVLATGTRPPDAALGDWQVFSVAQGAFSPESPEMGAPA
jgi:DNA replication and repair protein RecF